MTPTHNIQSNSDDLLRVSNVDHIKEASRHIAFNIFKPSAVKQP